MKKQGGMTWGAVESVKLRVLSLGAGIQSTTLLLMSLKGDITPRPDAVIFADTGDEGKRTMDYLFFLESETNRLSNGQIAITRVGAGERLSDKIRSQVEGSGKGFIAAPFFTQKGGMGRRQCTREFKIDPIQKKLREIMGYQPRQRIPPLSCEQWIGISTDEIVRATPARAPWIVNRFPLVEQRMSRGDCIAWLDKNGYPVPPKSACIFCPYHSDAEWRDIKDNAPDEWREVVSLDGIIRQNPSSPYQEYMHRSLKPLEDVDFSTDEERGQQNLFCEAGCGL